MNKLVSLFVVLLLTSCASPKNINKEQSLGYKGAEKRNVFGYNNPLAALSDLKAKKDHSYRKVSGDHGEWEIITNQLNHSVWSFTPEEHPAHPSVIRRKVFEKDGSVFIRTEVRCGAGKSVCDLLVKDFLKLDDKIKKEVGGL